MEFRAIKFRHISMRVRKISVLIDGGFLIKRIKDWPNINRDDPNDVADAILHACKRHVQRLIGESERTSQSRWLDHVYRLFFYDARPYDGVAHHPLREEDTKFAETKQAQFRSALFNKLREKRKFVLRLGVVKKDGDWKPYNRYIKDLLKIWHQAGYIRDVLADPTKADPEKNQKALSAVEKWRTLGADDIYLPLRQKGVDMRIGLDITTMTLKRQVDTIILMAGDSDFIPAAKVARCEGVEFILDPMWQKVDDGLQEHVDGLMSGFDQPSCNNAG